MDRLAPSSPAHSRQVRFPVPLDCNSSPRQPKPTPDAGTVIFATPTPSTIIQYLPITPQISFAACQCGDMGTCFQDVLPTTVHLWDREPVSLASFRSLPQALCFRTPDPVLVLVLVQRQVGSATIHSPSYLAPVFCSLRGKRSTRARYCPRTLQSVGLSCVAGRCWVLLPRRLEVES